MWRQRPAYSSNSYGWSSDEKKVQSSCTPCNSIYEGEITMSPAAIGRRVQKRRPGFLLYYYSELWSESLTQTGP